MMKYLEEIYNLAKGEPLNLAVVAAEDEAILRAVIQATEDELIKPILVGDEKIIKDILKSLNYEKEISILPASSQEEGAQLVMKKAALGEVDFLMKGLLDTSIILKALLNKEYGLRDKKVLSHMMLYEMNSYPKLLGLSDGGMNLAPSYEEKKAILENGIELFKALDYKVIKVAALAAKEKVSDKMPATLDARRLQEEVKEEGVIVEGPLALDLVFSKEAAEIKNFSTKIAGDVDFILVPTIETGNALGKSFSHVGGAKSAGVIMGAKLPLVLVSRADSFQAKLYSIALGKVIAKYRKEGR
ncbi:MAG: phosphate butyryltransferase [Tissierellia bacterium]|nr:phosphate butyryltransferase [Tissierellia bacterium]